MKKCVQCGAENDDKNAFCSSCGAKLLNGKTVCKACGAEVPEDNAFCGKCGTRVGCAAPPAPAAPRKSVKESVSDAVGKVKAFEGKRHYIANGIAAVFALVFLLVAILAPIRVEGSSMPEVTGDLGGSGYASSVKVTEVTTDAVGLDQKIWDIFGAFGYLGFDPENQEDLEEFQEMTDILFAANNKYEAWALIHPDASKSELKEKYQEFMAEAYGEINYFGYVFATAEMMSSSDDGSMSGLISSMRGSAIYSLVMAVIATVMQLAIALVALIVLIVSIVNMTKCKEGDPKSLLKTVGVLSGIGLIIAATGSELAAGGALFAIALTAAIAYLVCAVTQSVINRNGSVMTLVKNCGVAVLAMVAFFVVCGHVISLNMSLEAYSSEIITPVSEMKVHASLGSVMQMLIMCIAFTGIETELYTIDIKYGNTTVVSALLALVLGVVVMILLLVAMRRALANIENGGKKKAGGLLIASVLFMLLFAIMPAIFGAADSIKYGIKTERAMGITCVPHAYASLYVALGFTVAAFVFGIVMNKVFGEKKTAVNAQAETPAVNVQAETPATEVPETPAAQPAETQSEAPAQAAAKSE